MKYKILIILAVLLIVGCQSQDITETTTTTTLAADSTGIENLDMLSDDLNTKELDEIEKDLQFDF